MYYNRIVIIINVFNVFRRRKDMKILRISAQGLPLFKENLDIRFDAQQRVSENDKDSLYHL